MDNQKRLEIKNVQSENEITELEKGKSSFRIESAVYALNFIAMLINLNNPYFAYPDAYSVFGTLATVNGILGIVSLVRYFKCKDKLQEFKDTNILSKLQEERGNTKR